MDMVAIGAHPDDVELFAGGLLAKSVGLGYEVGIIHLTQAECSTRGTVVERRQEALDAAAALGILPGNVQFLDLGDTCVENTQPNRLILIEALRRFQPRLLLYAHPYDRHPDHRKGSHLVEDCYFYSHLQRIETGSPPFRPEGRLMFYNNSLPDVPPSMIVDVSEYFEKKMASLKAYRSQFFNPDYDGEETFISSRTFFEHIEARARYYGGLIGVRYAEPFRLPDPLAVGDPLACFLG